MGRMVYIPLAVSPLAIWQASHLACFLRGQGGELAHARGGVLLSHNLSHLDVVYIMGCFFSLIFGTHASVSFSVL